MITREKLFPLIVGLAVVLSVGAILYFVFLSEGAKAGATYNQCRLQCVTPAPTAVPSVEPSVSPIPTITETPTATPSPTEVPGNPDVSDNRSDGRSSCPECTKAPVVPNGAPKTGFGPSPYPGAIDK